MSEPETPGTGDSQRHWGTYECASVTERFHAFPLAGRGTLEFRPSGLALQAYRAGGESLRALAGCGLLFVVFVGVPVSSGLFGLDSDSTLSEGLVGGSMLLLFAAGVRWIARWKRSGDKEEPLVVSVPWKNLWFVSHGRNKLRRRGKAGRGELLFEDISEEAREADTAPVYPRGQAGGHQVAVAVERAAAPSGEVLSLVVGRWGRRKEVRFYPSFPSEPVAIYLALSQVTRT
ncbi:MAG: hypothetical protein VX498_06930 [Myxococcota bacterium]|nr:hypothetical protein [Myxococcota bacterium]